MKKYILLHMVFVISVQLQSAVSTCINNGNWGNTSTWSGGHVPYCTDTVVICGSHVVTLSAQQDYSACSSPIYIFVNGQLNFDTGNKMTLPTGSVVTINVGGSLNPGHGGGSSNLITIGNTNVWSAGDGNLNGYAVLTDHAPLPIELVFFGANVKNGIVELSWATASETNNDYFTIQRTKDGQNFEDVNTVAGAGTTSVSLKYNSSDKAPYKGISYYRLKQTDFNGDNSVSNIINVNVEENNKFAFELIMNPADGSKLQITTTSEKEQYAKIVIMDAVGKNIYLNSIVISKSDKKVNDLYLPEQLTSGIYMVGITYDKQTFCKKFIVQ